MITDILVLFYIIYSYRRVFNPVIEYNPVYGSSTNDSTVVDCIFKKSNNVLNIFFFCWYIKKINTSSFTFSTPADRGPLARVYT